jgi:hypothetical protein
MDPLGYRHRAVCGHYDAKYAADGEEPTCRACRRILGLDPSPRDAELARLRAEVADLRAHADLQDAIRNNKKLNESRQIAESSMTAILGRMSAYTGSAISWNYFSAMLARLVAQYLNHAPTVSTIPRLGECHPRRIADAPPVDESTLLLRQLRSKCSDFRKGVVRNVKFVVHFG